MNALVDGVEGFFAEALKTARLKNADYAGDQDPLANFRECERAGVPMTLGILVRMGDKWARLCRLMSGHEARVEDERIQDTLQDLANYCAILAVALSSTPGQQKPEPRG